MIGRIIVAIYRKTTAIEGALLVEWQWHLTIHDNEGKVSHVKSGEQPTRADAFKAVIEICDEIDESYLPVGPLTY